MFTYAFGMSPSPRRTTASSITRVTSLQSHGMGSVTSSTAVMIPRVMPLIISSSESVCCIKKKMTNFKMCFHTYNTEAQRLKHNMSIIVKCYLHDKWCSNTHFNHFENISKSFSNISLNQLYLDSNCFSWGFK